MRAFVVLGLVFFFHTEPSDWLRKTSPKWPVLCRVGHNVWPQLSQSVDLQQDAQWLCLIWKWWNESMDVQRHSLLWDCSMQYRCVQYRCMQYRCSGGLCAIQVVSWKVGLSGQSRLICCCYVNSQLITRWRCCPLPCKLATLSSQ